MKKFLIVIAVLFAVFYVIKNPQQAADMGRAFVAGVVNFASSLATGGSQ